jgi:hypothetical protein
LIVQASPLVPQDLLDLLDLLVPREILEELDPLDLKDPKV